MVVEPVTYIVKDSEFYDLLEREDMVMANRGFQIREELLFNFVVCKFSQGQEQKVK